MHEGVAPLEGALAPPQQPQQEQLGPCLQFAELAGRVLVGKDAASTAPAAAAFAAAVQEVPGGGEGFAQILAKMADMHKMIKDNHTKSEANHTKSEANHTKSEANHTEVKAELAEVKAELAEVKTELVEVKTEIADMRTTMRRQSVDTLARMYNAHALDDASALSPLANVRGDPMRIGAAVGFFPSNRGQLFGLNASRLRRLARDLGMPVETLQMNEAGMRVSVAQYCGLRSVPGV